MGKLLSFRGKGETRDEYEERTRALIKELRASVDDVEKMIRKLDASTKEANAAFEKLRKLQGRKTVIRNYPPNN